uniref:Forkhead box protein fkh-2 n=1 Tax=Romanomermis culicivorax TaxID=13658 RepID=A0A915I2V5_ROMCU
MPSFSGLRTVVGVARQKCGTGIGDGDKDGNLSLGAKSLGDEEEEEELLTSTAAINDDCLTNLNWLVQGPNGGPNVNPKCRSHQGGVIGRQNNGQCCCCDGGSKTGHCRNGYAHSTNTAEMKKDTDYKKVPVKPPYSYAQLIIMAMNAHGNGKVLLSDIYAWIRENFCYFKSNDTSWQNSVRHNLSLNKQFVKVPRAASDKGKGSYWMLEQHNKDPYCIRRRNFLEPQHRRHRRPDVDKPQINPAVKTFLERTQRLQDSRRHPFGGVGEQVEDIGAQECVMTDSDPIFDDFNRKLFKKDVELYDSVYNQDNQQQNSSQVINQHTSQKNMVTLPDISNLHSDLLHENSEPKVQVESLNVLWDSYTDLSLTSSFNNANNSDFTFTSSNHCQNSGSILETVIRIPSPSVDWWPAATSNNNSCNVQTCILTATAAAAASSVAGGGAVNGNFYNFLLSPGGNGNPLAKIFENSGLSSPINSQPQSLNNSFNGAGVFSTVTNNNGTSLTDQQNQNFSINDGGKLDHPWSDSKLKEILHDCDILLDIDYPKIAG